MKNLYKINDELYIISNTENVNENCWIITDGKLVQVSYLLSDEVAKGNKIILTTNKLLIKDGIQVIDDEFLEWFVKNPNCEEVEVKKSFADGSTFGYGYIENLIYKIIITKEEKDYTALLQPVGTKQETLEEVAEKFKNKELFKESNDRAIKILSEIKSLPIQERMYSEDEVIKLLEKRDKYLGNWLPPVKWLEQNKNK
jgi:hypothetical protein